MSDRWTKQPPAATGAAGQTFVGKLTLVDFRNYQALSIDLKPGAVVLTGENGAGKTNLLEAVSFLSPGRGLRRAAYADIARHGATDGFAVHARVAGPDGDTEIGTGTTGIAAASRRAGASASTAPTRARRKTCSKSCG